MALTEIALGGVATLFATLIGVFTAFRLDRRAEEDRKKQNILQHLKAIRKELEVNENLAFGNSKVLYKFQLGEQGESDHYVVSPFSTDAWDAALSSQLTEWVDTEVFQDLQDLYSITKTTNELVHRLRTELLHAEIGKEGSGYLSRKIWTIVVGYWNESKDEFDTLGLGPLIRNKNNEISSSIRDLSNELDAQIEELEAEVGEPVEDEESSYQGSSEKENEADSEAIKNE